MVLGNGGAMPFGGGGNALLPDALPSVVASPVLTSELAFSGGDVAVIVAFGGGGKDGGPGGDPAGGGFVGGEAETMPGGLCFTGTALLGAACGGLVPGAAGKPGGFVDSA
jgi:hypothetical protein